MPQLATFMFSNGTLEASFETWNHAALAGILGILARLLLQKTTAFLSTMSQAQQSLAGQLPNAGQPAAQPGEQLLLAVVDVWLDKFDCVASPYPRKLHALAMCLLLTLPSAPMLYRLEPLLGHISSVWFEVCTYCQLPR